MDSTLLIVITCVILLLLIVPLLFFVRRRVDLSTENDVLVMKYPLSTNKIDLNSELQSWELQEANYLWWGKFHAVHMIFKSGKQRNISSIFNQSNFDVLYRFLESRFAERKITKT
ncbi:hypothetical protein OKW21_002709 [Catalinimonas alkaloidigena]|uniref:hypothetical protein n=1 Tax=Catalinimonas alkaloidigena TaxID=1075417 RepID=UPI0024066CE7|nr:hypothetical protein [Catalinimonas alkaloidigena]MDF9797446.1 hypothetical protein [Catalinimonas alkaloidigena]